MALTKKITGAIVAIAFVLTTVLIFAFKADVKDYNVGTKKLPVQEWYEITPTISTDKTIQSVIGNTGEPDETNELGCAQLDNEGQFCAVLIEFADGTAPVVSSGSVQDILNSESSFVVTSEASSGYSRLPAGD